MIAYRFVVAVGLLGACGCGGRTDASQSGAPGVEGCELGCGARAAECGIRDADCVANCLLYLQQLNPSEQCADASDALILCEDTYGEMVCVAGGHFTMPEACHAAANEFNSACAP
jgi:hypothetical protein